MAVLSRSRQAFMDKLEREGRLPAFRARVKEVRLAGVGTLDRAKTAVLLEMGYVQPPAGRPSVEEDVSRPVTWEDSLRQLPQELRGRLPEELEWIFCHPAMSRGSRLADNSHILLTDRDREDAPNSGALNMLQWYCNHPAEFYKQVLDKMKKEPVVEDVGDFVKDMGLADVRRHLSSIEKGGRRVK